MRKVVYMIEAVWGIIPVELKTMSVPSAIIFVFILWWLRSNALKTKEVEDNLDCTEKRLQKDLAVAKDALKKELNAARKQLDEKIEKTVDNTMSVMESLKVDNAEIKESIKGILTYLTDMKQDIRDLRKKTQ